MSELSTTEWGSTYANNSSSNVGKSSNQRAGSQIGSSCCF